MPRAVISQGARNAGGIKVTDGRYKTVSAATPSDCHQQAEQGGAAHQMTSSADERVHFDRGSSGAELTGTLPHLATFTRYFDNYARVVDSSYQLYEEAPDFSNASPYGVAPGAMENY